MKAWLLPSGAGLAALLMALWSPRQELIHPRFGQPALPAPGGTFEMEVRTALPWTFRPGSVPRPVTAAGKVLEPLAIRWSLNRATLTFPADTVPDLAVTPWTGGREVRVVQVTDFPVPGQEGLLDQFVLEMRLLRPDLILATGDLLHTTTEAWYQQVVGRLKATGIPVVAIPGNHEREAWPRRVAYFGSRTDHRTDVGPFTILVMAHHPTFPAGTEGRGEGHGSGGNLKAFQARFVAACRRHGVTAVLSGHWHQDNVFDQDGRLRDDTADFPGPKFIVTACLGDLDRLVTRWPHRNVGYRVLVFQEGRLVRFTENPQGTGGPAPMWSQPLGRITRQDFQHPDGSWRGTLIRNGSSHVLRGSLEVDLGQGTRLAQPSLEIPPHSVRTLGQTTPEGQ